MMERSLQVGEKRKEGGRVRRGQGSERGRGEKGEIEGEEGGSEGEGKEKTRKREEEGQRVCKHCSRASSSPPGSSAAASLQYTSPTGGQEGVQGL